MKLSENNQRIKIHKDLLEAERSGLVKRVGMDHTGEIQWSLTERGIKHVNSLGLVDGGRLDVPT